jgi:hypothetical protein
MRALVKIGKQYAADSYPSQESFNQIELDLYHLALERYILCNANETAVEWVDGRSLDIVIFPRPGEFDDGESESIALMRYADDVLSVALGF